MTTERTLCDGTVAKVGMIVMATKDAGQVKAGFTGKITQLIWPSVESLGRVDWNEVDYTPWGISNLQWVADE